MGRDRQEAEKFRPVERPDPLAGPAMLKVALTGGIATGKSYVLEQFRRRGVPCLDADMLAHGVMAAGTEATAAIAARFGAEILAADGSVDRRKLGPDRVRRRVGAPRARGDRASGGLPRDHRGPARVRARRAGYRSPSSTCRCCMKPAPRRTSIASSSPSCPPDMQVARLVERGLSEAKPRASAWRRSGRPTRRSRARISWSARTGRSTRPTGRSTTIGSSQS